MELAGVVEAVGSVGDRVRGRRRRLRHQRDSANAEFVCVRESGALAHKPSGMSYEEAAAVSDGACIALACLQKADLLDGTAHRRLRRIRLHRNRRRAARQALWGRRDRRLRDEVRRARALAGRRRGRRLRARGLHEERRDLRRRLRRGRQALVPARAQLAGAGRDLPSRPISDSCGTSRRWRCSHAGSATRR